MSTATATTTTATAAPAIHKPASIDMFTPAQTCEQLAIDEQALLDLVNNGHLAAYNLGGNIRFKIVDVLAVTTVLAAA